MCLLQPICLEIIYKHNFIIYENQTKLARQRCLKGLTNPDHMDAQEHGGTTTPILMENKNEAIFYPTPDSGSNTPKIKFSSQEKPDTQTPTKSITNSQNPLDNLQASTLKYNLPYLIENFTKRADSFHAGQLKHKLCEWCEITSDSEVLQTVYGEKIEFNNVPHQVKAPKEKAQEDRGSIQSERQNSREFRT